MRTIIAGSRYCTDYAILLRAINVIKWKPTVIISGTARGADRLGERWAKANNIPIERFPANWKKYGRKAGFVRNKEMVDNAEALIALWDFKSPGTNNTIRQAVASKLVVHVEGIV